MLSRLRPRCLYQIFVFEFIPLFPDLQFLGHKARDSIVVLLIDLLLRLHSVLIYPLRSLRLDALLSIPIRKIPSLLTSFSSHKRHYLRHPSIPVHKLAQPPFFPMESYRIIQHANMQLGQVELIHLFVQVVGLPLTCIIKLGMLFVGVNVAVVADESMR